jgi:hypothetical protein
VIITIKHEDFGRLPDITIELKRHITRLTLSQKNLGTDSQTETGSN